jgi:hypothetical protein
MEKNNQNNVDNSNNNIDSSVLDQARLRPLLLSGILLSCFPKKHYVPALLVFNFVLASSR